LSYKYHATVKKKGGKFLGGRRGENVGENKRKNLNLNLRIFFLSRNPLPVFWKKTLSRPPHPPWPFGLPSSTTTQRLSLSLPVGAAPSPLKRKKT
jgi:hypothetical protein